MLRLYEARISVTVPSRPDCTISRALMSIAELMPWLPTWSTRDVRLTAAMISRPSGTV